MPRILACIDASVYLPSVCDLAAWAAARIGAGVEVLHVLDPHRERAAMADMTGAIGLGSQEALLDQLVALEATRNRAALEQGRTLLDLALGRLRSQGIPDAAGSLRHGTVVETVTGPDRAADLVVLGKRGEAADSAPQHLGSNLERVARATHRPLLVADRTFRPVQRMLIAFDGGPSAMQAVDYAAYKPLLKGLECHLLAVGNGDAATVERLDTAAGRLRAAGYDVQADIVPGQPDQMIAAHVRDRGIDLLVMGAYGHSRIRTLLIGSTTTEMLRGCPVPVLLFR